MKYMTMKNKCYAFDLQLFAEGEGGDGEEAGDEGDDPDGDDDPDEDGDNADEKKYSDKDMEEAIKKRLARERRKWQRKQSASQDDGNKDKPDGKEKESEDAKARKEAENKASRMEMKIACFEADVAKESVDDVTALAQAYMAADEDLDLEEAIEKVVKKYPQFKKGGAADPDEDEDKSTKGAWGQRQKGKGAKKVDGVEAAFLRKNPGLKID